MLKAPASGREPRFGGSARSRRLVAAGLATVGVAALAVAFLWQPGSGAVPDAAEPKVDRVAPSGGATPGTISDKIGENVSVPAIDAPGGIGQQPEKTGLPAKPGGGLVRTGDASAGCFPDIRSYLDRWHETGQEPDPCFTVQPPSAQAQPSGVQRSYNGNNF